MAAKQTRKKKEQMENSSADTIEVPKERHISHALLEVYRFLLILSNSKLNETSEK